MQSSRDQLFIMSDTPCDQKKYVNWLEKKWERPEKDIKREYLFIENYDVKQSIILQYQVGMPGRAVCDVF